MYKPDSKTRRLILAESYNSGIQAAYIYRDGVVLFEKRAVKVSENASATIDVYHIYPCEVELHPDKYPTKDELRINRIVCTRPADIFYGVQRVTLQQCQTDHLRDRGIRAYTITLRTADGIDINHMGIYEGIDAGITVQPHPGAPYTSHTAPDSIQKVIENKHYTDTIVMHDAQ